MITNCKSHLYLRVLKYLNLIGGLWIWQTNVMFVYIKGKNNDSADAISRLKTLSIYKEAVENPETPVVSSMQGNVTETCATDMHTMLHTEQKWDIMCRKLTSQLHYSNKSSLKSVIMSSNCILQK